MIKLVNNQVNNDTLLAYRIADCMKSYRRTAAREISGLIRFYDDEHVDAIDRVNIAVAQPCVFLREVRLQRKQ